MAHETQTPPPLLLTGDDLKEALEFSVEGPELSRGPLELRFQRSAVAAISGMRQWFLDHHRILVPEESIEVSGTYPPVARMARTGLWISQSGVTRDWNWDEFVETLDADEKDRLFGGNIALLVNADDFPLDIHGPAWGWTARMKELVAAQRNRHLGVSYGWGQYLTAGQVISNVTRPTFNITPA